MGNSWRTSWWMVEVNKQYITWRVLRMAILQTTDGKLIIADINSSKSTLLAEAIRLKLDLTKVDLKFGIYKNIDFSGAKMPYANMYWADFPDCHFIGTDLVGAYMRKGNFSRCNFTGANLELTCLLDSTLTETKLVGVNLSYALVARAELSRADMKNANLTGAVFDESVMCQVNLTNTDLLNTSLNAHLKGAIWYE